uniref:Uncharacterized protein n=1 Tax=Romanomermis culicivorax TaxID=13658 RepID=A0A915IAB2_ROMCU
MNWCRLYHYCLYLFCYNIDNIALHSQYNSQMPILNLHYPVCNRRSTKY